MVIPIAGHTNVIIQSLWLNEHPTLLTNYEKKLVSCRAKTVNNHICKKHLTTHIMHNSTISDSYTDDQTPQTAKSLTFIA